MIVNVLYWSNNNDWVGGCCRGCAFKNIPLLTYFNSIAIQCNLPFPISSIEWPDNWMLDCFLGEFRNFFLTNHYSKASFDFIWWVFFFISLALCFVKHVFGVFEFFLHQLAKLLLLFQTKLFILSKSILPNMYFISLFRLICVHQKLTIRFTSALCRMPAIHTHTHTHTHTHKLYQTFSFINVQMIRSLDELQMKLQSLNGNSCVVLLLYWQVTTMNIHTKQKC